MHHPPNILLVIADQHRFDWLEGHNELPVRTPNLRRLQERGMTFRRAVTPSPLCAPARACLATGLDYDSVPVRDNSYDLPPDSDSYFRELRDNAGYFVAGVGKFDLHKATFDWNLDGSRLVHEWGLSDGVDNEGKFDSVLSGYEKPRGPYMKHLYDSGFGTVHVTDMFRRLAAPYADTTPSPLPEDSYLDNWIAGNAHAFLDRRPRDKPWHLVVNFAGPHDPMDVTERMRDGWVGVDFPGPRHPGEFDGDHTEVRRRYAAMIENIDRHLGAFIDRLAADGDLDDTVVIYTSDHGEMLGDHGVWGKVVPLDPSIRIPLIVAGPMVTSAGTSSDALVSLEDLAATLLDIAGIPTPGTMTARSFLGVLRGETTHHRDFLICGLDRSARAVAAAVHHYGANQWVRLQRWRAVITDTEKLIVSDDLDEPYLFDLQQDPFEHTNLSAQQTARTAALSALVSNAFKRIADDTSSSGRTDLLDRS